MGMGAIREVRKRDGRVVPFDGTKIADAIYKAIRSVGKGDRPLAEELSAAVVHFLEQKIAGTIPGIEEIQDQVETVLIETPRSPRRTSFTGTSAPRSGMSSRSARSPTRRPPRAPSGSRTGSASRPGRRRRSPPP
jgi:hypothetical protein